MQLKGRLRGKQIVLVVAKEVNGALAGNSKGGFWDFSRAFEAEHSCSLLCVINQYFTDISSVQSLSRV